jgi:NADH-quinone oxidoreductase subunit M
VIWFSVRRLRVGVDGISVVMILLSAIIVFTGTFASWQLEPMKKEYFLWFVLLSIGVFGFFISTDLFTMFMFYEIALIPMDGTICNHNYNLLEQIRLFPL